MKKGDPVLVIDRGLVRLAHVAEVFGDAFTILIVFDGTVILITSVSAAEGVQWCHGHAENSAKALQVAYALRRL